MESKKTMKKPTKKVVKKTVKTTKPKATQTKKANGRPKLFTKASEIDLLAKEYFKYCDDNNKVYGVVGLCLFLKIDKSTGSPPRMRGIHLKIPLSITF